MTPKKIPMRMCIACREMKEKKSLLRIVKNASGDISLDFKGKAAGRGAYICDRAECINKCVKKKLLNKVFSCIIPDGVYEYIEKEYAEKSKRGDTV
ncbi:MAG: YlxR family protein [Clostridiales bacterium]|jgi:predicted RNA-binding protein YlxR (DUF448 family)|nr:YlxR family protein [Clostridiales bacterium]